MMYSKARGPLEILKEIMAMWPKGQEDDEILRQRFSGDITDDFDYVSFSNRARGEFSIFSKELVIGDEAKVLVYDSKESEYPNLATLIRSSDGEWRLKSFLFQCVSCFGVGVLSDGNPCNTCGATGWGLAKYPEKPCNGG